MHFRNYTTIHPMIDSGGGGSNDAVEVLAYVNSNLIVIHENQAQSKSSSSSTVPPPLVPSKLIGIPEFWQFLVLSARWIQLLFLTFQKRKKRKLSSRQQFLRISKVVLHPVVVTWLSSMRLWSKTRQALLLNQWQVRKWRKRQWVIQWWLILPWMGGQSQNPEWLQIMLIMMKTHHCCYLRNLLLQSWQVSIEKSSKEMLVLRKKRFPLW